MRERSEVEDGHAFAAHAPLAPRGPFRSLRVPNYRLWAAGALVSNVGTWMQRIAQDWLVLTQLTHNNASAVGVVSALQFGPQLLLLPWTGMAADRLDRRKLLLTTQGAMGALAFGLGLLTITGLVRLWHVYLFAFLLGCVTAFDAPTRHTFVADLVGDRELSNAVALNSASFNAARMIGPAIAGVLIAAVGSGAAFLLNAASFLAVLTALAFIHSESLHGRGRGGPAAGGIVEGLRYLWGHPDLRVVLLMLFLIGTFGLNFPVFISTMAATVFHAGAGRYGLLTSTMAVGSVAGALGAAARTRPTVGVLAVAAGLFGIGCSLAAVMPSPALFGLMLILVGASAQSFTASSNGLMQMASEPRLRGRVISIFLAVAMGTTPLGAPLVGWVADAFGPRWALGVGGGSGFAAAAVAIAVLRRRRRARHPPRPR
jgi:MFS family permease